jgi:hypothetical protein
VLAIHFNLMIVLMEIPPPVLTLPVADSEHGGKVLVGGDDMFACIEFSILGTGESGAASVQQPKPVVFNLPPCMKEGKPSFVC